MGCDIHLYTEINTGKAWEPLRSMRVDEYSEKPGVQMYMTEEGVGRNYRLFALLANVRNGHGFAGVDLGDPTVPVSEPKGLPVDVSPECRTESDNWGVDGHSHSWFTLAEMYEHDWSSKVVNRCWVRRKRNAPPLSKHWAELEDPDAFRDQMQKLATSYPDDWMSFDWYAETCGDSSEGQGPSGWRTMQWESTHRHEAGRHFFALLFDMACEAHKRGVSPSDVRIVFWFDN